MRRHVAALALAACATPGVARAQGGPEVRWLVFDFPPYFRTQGEQQGNGIYDRFLVDLHAELPGFQHRREPTSPHRAEVHMKQGAPLCAVSRFRTAERDAYSVFASQPHLQVLPVELVLAQRSAPTAAPLLHDGRLSLAALLEKQVLRLGAVEERRFGEPIDALLARARAAHHASLVPWTTSALASDAPRLMALKRFDAVLAYPSEFTVMRAQYPQQQLVRWPLDEAPALVPAVVSCSASDTGRAVIDAVNRLPARRASTARLLAGYEALLPPEDVEAYRRRVAALASSH